MTLAKTIAGALLLALLAPSATFAAGDPTITVRSVRDMVVYAKYTNMPEATVDVYSLSTQKDVVTMQAIKTRRGTLKIELPEGTPDGQYKLMVYPKGSNAPVVESAPFTVKHEAPTCTLRATKKVVNVGDIIQLRWTSEHAAHAIDTYGRKVEAEGSSRVSIHKPLTREFGVVVVGKGGIGTCHAKVKVKEESD